LEVWKKAHEFVLDVYKTTKKFPKEEMFGLTSQFRRAAVSIPANIAEGYGKKSKKDKLRFYNISEGSIQECDYYITLSKDLKYIDGESDLSARLATIGKMLKNYIKRIEYDVYKSGAKLH
jgi:four helix bundle protein